MTSRQHQRRRFKEEKKQQQQQQQQQQPKKKRKENWLDWQDLNWVKCKNHRGLSERLADSTTLPNKKKARNEK